MSELPIVKTVMSLILQMTLTYLSTAERKAGIGCRVARLVQHIHTETCISLT